MKYGTGPPLSEGIVKSPRLTQHSMWIMPGGRMKTDEGISRSAITVLAYWAKICSGLKMTAAMWLIPCGNSEQLADERS